MGAPRPSPLNALSVSVIVPVYNGAATLGDTLRSLRDSSCRPGQIIVVDDGSTDASARIAEEFGVTVLSTRGRCGPAVARGIGAEEATGTVLLFLDSDVCVHPGTPEREGTIARIVRILEERLEVDAVFGSYDTRPTAPNFVSQWKNLSHHFVHQHGAAEAQTFWAGCGAIRKDVFQQVGGFDHAYRGATIEDIELGYRLRQHGFRILLDPAILCTHAKRWTAWSTWKTDLLYRGIPWTRLILRTGIVPNDLNVSIAQRISTAVAWLMVLAFAFAAIRLPVASLMGMLLFVLILLHAWWMEPPAAGARVLRWLGPFFTVAVALGLAVLNGLTFFAVCLSLGVVLAVFFRRRPENRRSRLEDFCYSAYFGVLLAALVLDLPREPEILAAACLALLLLGLNQAYYTFFARERGVAFLMATLPFQFLYHFTNGISVLAGALITFRERRGPVLSRSLPVTPAPNPEAVDALEQPALNRHLGAD